VTAELKKYFGDKLCKTTIPRNVRLAEAPSHGKPAILYDAKSRGAESYMELAQEIVGRSMPDLLAKDEPKEKGSAGWRKWIQERNKLISINILDR